MTGCLAGNLETKELQASRAGGLEAWRAAAWRAGWQLAGQDANVVKRPAVALVNKRIASQQGQQPGGLAGSWLTRMLT